MASKWDSLQKQLLQSLDCELNRYSFKLKMSDWAYRRPTPYGFDLIRISFSTYRDLCTDAMPSIGLRHEEICRVVNPHTDNWDEKQKKVNLVVGRGIQYLVNDGSTSRWSLQTEEDVAPAVAGIMHLVHSFAFPYFERFSSLEEILDVCASRDQSKAFNSVSEVRPAFALAAAYLIGDRDRYNSVLADLTDYIESVPIFNDTGNTTFYAVAADLEQRWKAKESGAGNLSTGTI